MLKVCTKERSIRLDKQYNYKRTIIRILIINYSLLKRGLIVLGLSNVMYQFPCRNYIIFVFKGGKITVNFYTTWYCLNCFGQLLELFHSEVILFSVLPNKFPRDSTRLVLVSHSRILFLAFSFWQYVLEIYLYVLRKY